jgi:Type III flagellar switch regulator (C-ring) FliN C-term
MFWKTWLPAEALIAGPIERQLEGMAESWSGHWFARRLIGTLGAARHEPTDLEYRYLDGGLAIGLHASTRREIAALMLDEPVEARQLNAADQALLDGMGSACLDDLCGRLATAFKAVPAGPWLDSRRAPACVAGAATFLLGASDNLPLLRILIAADLASRFVKSSSGASTRPIRLRPLSEGLAKQRIGLSARVGQCELSLEEFAGLTPGDVLVLDSGVGQTLDLAVDGLSRSGRCTVDLEGDALRLRILNPPARMIR